MTSLNLPLVSGEQERVELNQQLDAIRRDLRLNKILRRAGVPREHWMLGISNANLIQL